MSRTERLRLRNNFRIFRKAVENLQVYEVLYVKTNSEYVIEYYVRFQELITRFLDPEDKEYHFR